MEGRIVLSRNEAHRVRVIEQVIVGVITLKEGVRLLGREFPARQHLNGMWSVWKWNKKVASHKATEFKQSVRSWKPKKYRTASKAKEALRVYGF